MTIQFYKLARGARLLLLEKAEKTWHVDGNERFWSPPKAIWQLLREPKRQCAEPEDDAVLNRVAQPGAQALLEYLRTLSPRFELQNMEPGELVLSGLAVIIDQVDLI